MKQNTICPLLTNKTVTQQCNTIKTVTINPVPCVQKKCAWWVEDKQKCAITAIESVKK